MKRTERSLTLGDLVWTVSRLSRDEREASMVVADMVQRGLVRLVAGRRRGRRQK